MSQVLYNWGNYCGLEERNYTLRSVIITPMKFMAIEGTSVSWGDTDSFCCDLSSFPACLSYFILTSVHKIHHWLASKPFIHSLVNHKALTEHLLCARPCTKHSRELVMVPALHKYTVWWGKWTYTKPLSWVDGVRDNIPGGGHGKGTTEPKLASCLKVLPKYKEMEEETHGWCVCLS